MRYTERKHNREINDLFDFVTFLVLTVFAAPYRMLSEIGNKLMYLKREAIEKLILLTVVIITIFIVWDGIRFIIFRKLELTTGVIPLAAKFIVLAIVGFSSMYLINRFNYLKELDNFIYEGEDTLESDLDFSLEKSSEKTSEEDKEEDKASEGKNVEPSELSSHVEPSSEQLDLTEVLEELPKSESIPLKELETIELSEEVVEPSFNFFKEISPSDILSNLEKNESILSRRSGKVVSGDKEVIGAILLSDKDREELK